MLLLLLLPGSFSILQILQIVVILLAWQLVDAEQSSALQVMKMICLIIIICMLSLVLLSIADNIIIGILQMSIDRLSVLYFLQLVKHLRLGLDGPPRLLY